jgi:hypothetical protein
MRLIKEGNKLPEVYRATCGKCGAVWEADPCEVTGFHRNEVVVYTKTCTSCNNYGLSFKKYLKELDK